MEEMRRLRNVRMRGGAFQWGLFVDTADLTQCIEEFMVESWAEHLRQHERMTVDDSEIQQSVVSMLDGQPRVSHYLAAKMSLANQSKETPSVSGGLSAITPIESLSKYQLRSVAM